MSTRKKIPVDEWLAEIVASESRSNHRGKIRRFSEEQDTLIRAMVDHNKTQHPSEQLSQRAMCRGFLKHFPGYGRDTITRRIHEIMDERGGAA